jgi:hypothetical protein
MHLFFDYPLPTTVWVLLGVAVLVGHFSLWDLQAPLAVDSGIWRTGIYVVL